MKIKIFIGFICTCICGILLGAGLPVLAGFFLVSTTLVYLIHRASNKLISNLHERYHTWAIYRRDLRRDYSHAFIGDSVIYYDLTRDKNLLDWTFPEQSVCLMFEIVKRFFSVLKKGGEIHVYISAKQLNSKGDTQMSLFFYPLLHHWLIPNYKEVFLKRIKYLYLYDPILTFKLIRMPIMKRLFIRNRKRKLIVENVTNNALIIENMDNFCTKRNIKLYVHLAEEKSLANSEIFECYHANRSNKINII